jgi:ATP-dependent RNA helicase DDX5/DBP2
MNDKYQSQKGWGQYPEYDREEQGQFAEEEPLEDVKEFEEDKIEVLFNDENYEHRPIRYFEEAGFPQPILQVIQSLNFKQPTKIQCHSIPIAMNEFDVIGIAKTGSGKTLAFLLPGICKLLEHIRYLKESGHKYNNREAPFILVLAPTRELAMQIYNSALPFTQKLNLNASVVYGGASMGQQIKSVRYVDLLIATPGRLIDLLSRQIIRLDQVAYFVLDEADKMLDMGFMPQVEEIMQYLTTERQNLLWSATWPKEIQNLSTQICINETATIKIGSDDLTINSDIEQVVEVVEDNQKLGRLFDILKTHHSTENSKNLIFVKTKVWCERLAEILSNKGITAMALHGDKSQNVTCYLTPSKETTS